MCYINILSKLLDFSRRSAVQFGLKKPVKNTGIPVFTGILMAVYRYSVFAISIHSRLYRPANFIWQVSISFICSSVQCLRNFANFYLDNNIHKNITRLWLVDFSAVNIKQQCKICNHRVIFCNNSANICNKLIWLVETQCDDKINQSV
jgi:hypothetical protein